MTGRLTVVLVIMLCGSGPASALPEPGQRFPPLRVPPGFEATLFACDPLIEYPSVIAVGPRVRSIFLAQDYMTGLGTEIIRRDEILVVEDTNRDGHADSAVLYADGFNSIEGLDYHAGTVFVMHAPLLTALRDTDGDGVADERRDLLDGLGLTPEKNPVRLHCANGVVAGHDGWLYLVLGDQGCDVRRPEGDRLVLVGGGIFRCRLDGSDLHVFATGLRNTYDIALDAELNVFLRDNENDGGDYMIRVCHSFFGADHGYPYLFAERPDEALAPLADLGRGSSAGATCYLETAFPPEYRGTLLFCEWGRAVVSYRREREGSTFRSLQEVDFASGAENDPYGFKPTDLVVDRDGALFVSDWADGQRPKRGRGRVYRITAADSGSTLRGASGGGAGSLTEHIKALDSAGHHARLGAQQAIEGAGTAGLTALRAVLRAGEIGTVGRLHAIRILARVGGREMLGELFEMAANEVDARVRAQAIRALADLTDPVLVRHRLDAGRGDAVVAARFAGLVSPSPGGEVDDRVLLEIIVALGRLRWIESPRWLSDSVEFSDLALAHAAMQTLRRSQNWPGVLELLDEPGRAPIAAVALRALAGHYEPAIVDGLVRRLGDRPAAERRRAYADLLARVHRRPGPREYWGYRPAPRPANTIAWERTAAIETALDHILVADPDRGVRRSTLRRMQRENVPVRLQTLARWLRDERGVEEVGAILDSLRQREPAQTRVLLVGIARESRHATVHRLTALHELRKQPAPSLVLHLGALLSSPVAAIRAAAVQSLVEIKARDSRDRVRPLLADTDVDVRREAAVAAGALEDREATGALLRLVRDGDAGLRRACFDSLRRLDERRVVPFALAEIGNRDTGMAALKCLAELGGPEHAAAVLAMARTSRAAEVLEIAVGALAAWRDDPTTDAATRPSLRDAIAAIQGESGALIHWRVLGPISRDAASRVIEGLRGGDAIVDWRVACGRGTDFHVALEPSGTTGDDKLWIAVTDFTVPRSTPVQFLASTNGSLTIWLNGERIHERAGTAAYQPDAERPGATLPGGVNRLVLEIGAVAEARFHLRFRARSSSAEREKLTQAALEGKGNPGRGHDVFFNVEKSQCVTCHRIGERGGRVGPELTGVGSRFSRAHIIEAILDPGRAIAPSYGTVVVTLRDGRALTGVRVMETANSLVLGDREGKIHELATAAVLQILPQPVSLMPEGLEKRLSQREFVDLIAFLVKEKEIRDRR